MTAWGVAVASPDPRAELDADVLVVGGGLGGCAAALAACEAGARVVLTEEGDRLGGQLTAQAVSCPDEHPLVEHTGTTRAYAALRERIRAAYRAQGAPARMPDGAPLNPGDGWVSRLCAEPGVARSALEGLLADQRAAGRLEVRRGLWPRDARVHAGRIHSVTLADASGSAVRVRAEVVCEATEAGDLLTLVGAPWSVGAEARADTGERDAPVEAAPTRTQAITVPALLRWRAEPSEPLAAPAGYRRWRASQPFTLAQPDAAGNPRDFRMSRQSPQGLPPFWTYRRVRAGWLLGGEDVSAINWPSNDAVDADYVDALDRRAVVAGARDLTRAFVRWLQTECPRDDDRPGRAHGRGYPELVLDPVTAETGDGLAAAPYVREARRLRGTQRITAEDLRERAGWRVRARHHANSLATGWYPLDVHGRVGDPHTTWNEPTRPFQVPAGALVGTCPSNLIAAGKALSTTQLAQGSHRVHPVEWAVGEAAGTAAALAVRRRRTPLRLLRDHEAVLAVQRRLVLRGAPIAWVSDVHAEDPRFPGAQLLAAHGALTGRLAEDLAAAPDRRLEAREAEAVQAALLACLPGGQPGPDRTPTTFGDASAVLARALTATDRPTPRSVEDTHGRIR